MLVLFITIWLNWDVELAELGVIVIGAPAFAKLEI